MAEAPPSRVEVEERYWQTLWATLDTNGDGLVSKEEMRVNLERKGLPCSTRDVDDVFAFCAPASKDLLTFDEFKRASVNQSRNLRLLFDSMDKNADGSITEDELAAKLKELHIEITPQKLIQLMERMDENHDQKVSWDEFRTLLQFSSQVSDVFKYWSKAAGLMYDQIDKTKDGHDNDPWYIGKVLMAGGLAGAVSRTTTAPLDRLKVLLQVQSSYKGAPPKYTGVAQGLRVIYQEGGFKAFFKGNGVNVVKIAPETAIKFLTYDACKRLVSGKTDTSNINMMERFLAGAMAGVTGQMAIYPLEVVKTRLAVFPTGTYNGILDCLVKVSRQDGVKALYRGLTPSLLGVIPYAGIDLCMYETVKKAYIKAFPDQQPGVATLLGCGAISSISGQAVAYPLALVRTRLQAQSKDSTVQYSGLFDCLKKTVKADGVSGLYKGMYTNMLKVVPAVSITYVVYEKTKEVLEIK